MTVKVSVEVPEFPSVTLTSLIEIVALSLLVIVPVPVSVAPAPTKVTDRPPAERLLSNSCRVSSSSTLLSLVVLTVTVRVVVESAANSVTLEEEIAV